MDEAQRLYEDPTAFSRRQAGPFWDLLDSVLADETSRIRILMCAAYEHGSPIQMPSEQVLGSKHLNLSQKEVEEYVKQWFQGFKCLERDAVEPFCARLLWLTGGYVGLCKSAIHALEKLYFSRMRKGNAPPSTQEWLCMLESGSLYEDNDRALFDGMISRGSAQLSISLLTIEQMDNLYRIVCGIAMESDADTLELCLRKGILTRNGNEFDFTSPVAWRYFVLWNVDWIERAPRVPNSLRQMMERVIDDINYDTIRQALDKNSPSSNSVERAWQLEYYQALYRCTPSHFVTSADVGALFGTKEFIDFTIRVGNEHWGIDLLRQGESLDEHMKRFAPGGRYSLLELSNFCLLEFRHVTSVDEAIRESVAANDDKCVVVCYDAGLKSVAVLNSHFGAFSKTLLLLFVQ